MKAPLKPKQIRPSAALVRLVTRWESIPPGVDSEHAEKAEFRAAVHPLKVS